MPKKKSNLQKNLTKVWKKTKKQLNKAAQETSRLIKKGEGHIKDLSFKGKIKSEILILKTKRESLYYYLGRAVAISKTKTNKKIEKIQKEINEINKEIKIKEKAL
jgi:hypothetical protein